MYKFSGTAADVHSVFDLMSPEDREKLKRLTTPAQGGGTAGDHGGGSGHKPVTEKGSRWDQRPGSSMAEAIVSGCK